MEIVVNSFKRIASATIELGPINVLIGGNNSGKSSFIQGIQFAISAAQTLELKAAPWRSSRTVRILALDSDDFLYSPTSDIATLYHGGRLAGAKNTAKKMIKINFINENIRSSIEIKKGNNGGYTTTHYGSEFGEALASLRNPYCVYVPGISGVPIREPRHTTIGIRKSAIRGDSNSFLRNILWEIKQDATKWERFCASVERIYPNTLVNVDFDGTKSEFVNASVSTMGITSDIPIDLIGTGALQVIQIFSYIEYFSPKLVLLDEPDAHLHPSKQIALVGELILRTQEDPDIRIVISSHSKYILNSLPENANVHCFVEGEVKSNIEAPGILLDIGAIDHVDLFSKANLKYIIVTEDSVSNIKQDWIRKFVLSHGINDDEFILHSYEGCGNFKSARVLQDFARKHIPNVEVIVHIDRDQRIENDRELELWKQGAQTQGVKLFITELSEIESYFCRAEHIAHVTNVPLEEVRTQISSFKEGLRNLTKRKVEFFLLNKRVDLLKPPGSNQIDLDLRDELVELYLSHYDQVCPGKELIAKIKAWINQDIPGILPNSVLSPSIGLISESFSALLN